jgi:hypothetical protein
MRTLLVTSAAWLALAAVPFIAHAAGPVLGAPGATGDVPRVTVAQSSSGTVLPGVTVTAPAPPMNPGDISTWRLTTGRGPNHPPGGSGMGNGGPSGALVAALPR